MTEVTARVENDTERSAPTKSSATNEPSESSTRHVDKIRLESGSENRCATDDVGGGEMRTQRERTEMPSSSPVIASITGVEADDPVDDPTEGWSWEAPDEVRDGVR